MDAIHPREIVKGPPFMQQLDDIAVNVLEQTVIGEILTEEEADASVDLWQNSGEGVSWTDYYIEQGILSRHFKVRLNMICRGLLPSSHVSNCFLQNGFQKLQSEISSWLAHKEMIESDGSGRGPLRPHSEVLFDEDFKPMPGMTIENFLLIRNIGLGAAGAVFEAIDLSSKETVALKIFKKRNPSQEYKSSPLGGQNFIEEAQLLCWLDHENIVKSLSYVHGNVCALVMEYIPGFTLQQLIDQGGRIPVDKCCKILLKVLHALAYIHEHNLIHRDIKPANILISTEGVVKLTDLGIAKITNDLNALGSQKQKRLVGTPYYIAPEQIFSPETADARSDIYSFGATFYHAVTGQTPYIAKNVNEMINMHIRGNLTPPHEVCRDIPVELSNIIVNMMHRVSEDRYGSVAEVIQEIEAAVEELNSSPATAQLIARKENDDEPVNRGLLRYEDDYFRYSVSDQQMTKSYKFKADNPWQRDAATKEVYLHNNLSHENILNLKESRLGTQKVELLYTWDSYDFIGELIHKDFIFYSEAVWEIAAELVTALEFLHQHGISHGNLNPYAVVVNSKNVKLLDFSMATDHHSPDVEAYQAGIELQPYFTNNRIDGHSFAADIRCLGQLLTACSLSGYLKDVDRELRNINVGSLENSERDLDDALVALLKSMMHETPEKRPHASDLLENLFHERLVEV